MKDVAFATSPREFDLSYSTTLEEIMEKLNARRVAFAALKDIGREL